jgi:LacI family transcriptional regulator
MSDRFQPPLTTIRVGEYELGRQAARLLLGHIEQPERLPETVLVTPELVVRDSSAKPARRHRVTRTEPLASDSPAVQY